jgi:hypothetical protein
VNDGTVGPKQDPTVLAALPGTVKEILDWLAAELPVQATVTYDETDGHPYGANSGTTEINFNLRPTG